MSENEMSLDEPATRRDLRELRTELKAELKAELKNHPTHAQLDASLRQVMQHIDTTVATTVAAHTKAIVEEIRDQIRGLDDQYRDLPARVTTLEAAVFSRPPKRKRKAGSS